MGMAVGGSPAELTGVSRIQRYLQRTVWLRIAQRKVLSSRGCSEDQGNTGEHGPVIADQDYGDRWLADQLYRLRALSAVKKQTNREMFLTEMKVCCQGRALFALIKLSSP
jgi:hypothetical protein